MTLLPTYEGKETRVMTLGLTNVDSRVHEPCERGSGDACGYYLVLCMWAGEWECMWISFSTFA